jgi:hypothetical protein
MSKFNSAKLIFVGTIILFSSFNSQKVYSATSSLRDVPQSHWARNSVKTLVEDYGFMQGDPNGNFGGSRAISRYEFAKTMTNMLDYLKKQMDEDHKDLEDLVSVMEMFQTEIKALEAKVASANAEVAKQNLTVNELNEIVVALGDEYNTLKSNTGAAPIAEPTPAPESFEVRLTQVEEKVDSLKNRGLFVDTLLRGTLNDIRNVTMGTGKILKSAGSSIKDSVTTDASEASTQVESQAQETKQDVTIKEEVKADVSKHQAPQQEPLAPPAPQQEPQAPSSPAQAVQQKTTTKQETKSEQDPTHGFYDDEDVDDEDLEDIDSFYD